MTSLEMNLAFASASNRHLFENDGEGQGPWHSKPPERVQVLPVWGPNKAISLQHERLVPFIFGLYSPDGRNG